MSSRIAFLGAGFMAGTHARALAQLPGAELVAVCAGGDPSAVRFAEEVPGEIEVFEEFGKMLDVAGPDALYVCLPPFAHGGEVEEAAGRGIGIFLEKPIALGLERARSMVEAVEKAGVVNQIGFQMRFHPSVIEMRRRIDSGEAGAPVLFSGRYWTNMDGSAWWRDPSLSGGQILEQVIHIYDLAAHLMGPALLERASGHMATVIRGADPIYRIEDVSAGMIPLANGGVCVVTGCNAARPMHFIADFRAVFGNALLDYRCAGQPWVAPDSATLTAGEAVEGEWSEGVNLTLLENAHFLGALRDGRTTEVPLRAGLRALEWVLAVKSAATAAGRVS